VPALSFDHNPVVFKILLRASFSEPRPVLDYMHDNCSFFRSTLGQLIVTNPCIRERTDLEHTIQDFYSAVRQIAFPAIPQLTFQCHLLTPYPGLVNLMTSKKLLPTALSRIRIPPVSSPPPTSLPYSHFLTDSTTKF